MIDIAKKYRTNENLTGGFVVFNKNNIICGWALMLDRPEAYEPGCIAIDENGQKFIATGGNDYDGAEFWKLEKKVK